MLYNVFTIYFRTENIMTTLRLALPYQTSYSIKTDSIEFAAYLRIKYGKYLSESEEEAEIEISVTQNAACFDVVLDGEKKRTAQPMRIFDQYLFDNNRYDNSVLALHGAAVEYGGRAYLFLASSTAGKTTLCAYLLSLGFGFVTEDCILVDRSTFDIHPCTAPVHLRDGGLSVLRNYNAAPEKLFVTGEEEARRYVFAPENCVSGDIPLGRIFFIERTVSENAVLPMTTTERLVELLHSPITLYPVTSEYLKLLSRLAKEDCVRLKYSDMAYAAEVIQNE